jgi:nucleoside-diphosphate-sugar epimerase
MYWNGEIKITMLLVTGSQGQIGSDLVIALGKIYGVNQVVTSGRRAVAVASPFPYEVLDVTDYSRLQSIIETDGIETLYHLAGLLSAKGEQYPEQCWQINVNGLKHVLEVARDYHLKVFWPSSIAVFGPHTPKLHTPQTTIEDPSTMYGITKVTGEMLCQYYAQHFGVDVRSVRFPGIISHRMLPGGGTTDFAVEIFYAALQTGHYTCFVRPDTRLPMMYMPDAIRAILEIMTADAAKLTVRSSYNLTAVSFSAAELVAEIQQHLPQFTCDYAPDYRQAIADSWPSDIDDTQARQDWGWQPQYALPAIVQDMLLNLQQRLSLGPAQHSFQADDVSCTPVS